MQTVAIAGATGFVGSALVSELASSFHVVGLSRSERTGPLAEWRACDLYALRDVERALEGCDFAVYLVHSMLPSARLTQASFEDLDLILADNFARAAAKAGVKQIVYLGGLLPTSENLSRHLGSRREVERALGAHGVPVTTLRAGMVAGPGGSSLHIMLSLVRRLPLMITPSWTESPTQPIALEDVLRAVKEVLGEPQHLGRTYDIGGPDVMSYRDMMRRTATLLGKRRPMLGVPLFTPRLSTLWVSLITGVPTALVGPLVESLEHPMTVDDNPLQRWLVKSAVGFEESLHRSIDARGRLLEAPRITRRRDEKRSLKPARTVRSVQRLRLPRGRDAIWAAREYVRWLPEEGGAPLLYAEVDGDRIELGWAFPRVPLLVLRFASDRNRPDHAVFLIEGGLLAKTDPDREARFEMRLALDDGTLIAAVHEFSPTLPWWIYNATQALAHLYVMHRFRLHLASTPEAPAPALALVHAH